MLNITIHCTYKNLMWIINMTIVLLLPTPKDISVTYISPVKICATQNFYFSKQTKKIHTEE